MGNIPERLRQARLSAGEDLALLAKRTGVRQENLRAIEDGRFADLPPGIYGRAAIRAFGNAFGLDGAAILAECEPLLTPLDEPIAALARARGLRARPGETIRVQDDEADADDSAFPGWRQFVAAAVDACVIGGLLVLFVIAALTLLTAPVSALRHSAGAFAIMGMVLGAGYFLCFGGVRGETVGERTLSIVPRRPSTPAMTLRTVAERALLAATEDARCLQRWGGRLAEYAEIQRAKRSA
jgi:hypothetical protein